MTWDDLRECEITIYSTAWCPDCRRLEQHLDAHGVRYRQVDIDRDPAAAAELQRETGRTAIPYVRVDGSKPVRGWHDEKAGRWDDALFLAEIEQAMPN